MLRRTTSQVSARTFDYLARKHPWFDAIMRNRGVAISMFLLYAAIVFLMVAYVHSGGESGWKEIIKSYSPLFFDLLIIFVLSSVFLVFRGYFIEENSRVDIGAKPDESLFRPLSSASVALSIDDNDFFERHPAVSAILDALPIDQSDYFLAHAGSLDIPKLTVKSIEVNCEGGVDIRLGVGSFKDFFFTHHFPDYALSRSSARNSGKKETLRQLFSPIYFRSYERFFSKVENRIEFLKYTPNTLGVTGCVQFVCGSRKAVLFQQRGYHESAARGGWHLSYAGTIDAYPDFTENSQNLSVEGLANNEFIDEVMKSAPGLLLNKRDPNCLISHQVVGVCANSQYLFQPELFVLTTISLSGESVMDDILERFGDGGRDGFWAVDLADDIDLLVSSGKLKLRPLCVAAIRMIYRSYL